MTDIESYRKWAGDWRSRANEAEPAQWAIEEIERLHDQLIRVDPHGQNWRCVARTGRADPPSDCAWPECGCDPNANKVIETLEERGLLRTSQDMAKET